MSLEQALAANTKAVNELVALLSARAALNIEPAQITQAKPQPAPDQQADTPPAPETLTYPVLAKRFQRFAKADREAAVALLAEYDAKNLQQVDPTKWAGLAERMGEEVAA